MSDLAEDSTTQHEVSEFAQVFLEEFVNALLAADRADAEDVALRAVDAGMEPTAIHTLVIEPAMVRIGELWERDQISEADEHVATDIAHRVLVRIFDGLKVAPRLSRERVVLAGVEGQHHVLGLRMVADVLEGAGFDVLFLGANVPVEALGRFVAAYQPAITGLSFGIAVNVSSLVESIYAIREAAPDSRIMLGGRATPPNLGAGGFPWVKNSSEVLRTVEELLARQPRDIPRFFEELRPDRAAQSNLSPTGGGEEVAVAMYETAATGGYVYAPSPGGEPPPDIYEIGALRIDLYALAEEVCRRCRLEYDESDSARAATDEECRRDNQWLLSWAIADVQGVTDLDQQARWMSRIQQNRGISAEHCTRNLHIAAEVVREGAIGELSESVASSLERAAAGLG